MALSKAVSGQVSIEAQAVLVYMFDTRTNTERTLRAIADACQLGNPRQPLMELIHCGYLNHVGDSTFALTSAGRQLAYELHPSFAPRNLHITQNIESVSGGYVAMTGTLHAPFDMPDMGDLVMLDAPDEYTETDSFGTQAFTRARRVQWPSVLDHPLRGGARKQGDTGPLNERPAAVSVRYMLAFETATDALPVPVLNGDILGRHTRADICLTFDEFVSSQHCRFHVCRDDNSGHTMLYIEDLSSRNGTQVNDVYLEDLDGGLHPLYHGDRLRIGRTVLIVTEIPR
jgi:hypothetical protein